MVDHIHLYNPAFRRLLALLPGLGRVQAILAQAGNRGPYRSDTAILWDWGAHDVAMMLAVMKGCSPVNVEARATVQACIDGVDAENLELTVEFEGGVRGRTLFGTLMDKTRRFAVFGEAGTLVYDDLSAAKLVLHPPSDPDQWPKGPSVAQDVEAGAPLTQVILDFANTVTGQRPDDGGLKLGVDVVDILFQAQAKLHTAKMA